MGRRITPENRPSSEDESLGNTTDTGGHESVAPSPNPGPDIFPEQRGEPGKI